MTTLRTVGARVSGQYYGVPFTGKIWHGDIVGNGAGANGYAVCVDLDTPINLWGSERTDVRCEVIPEVWDTRYPNSKSWKVGRNDDGDTVVRVLEENK